MMCSDPSLPLRPHHITSLLCLEQAPSPDQILPTLTYLYTGKLCPWPSTPEEVYGLLANAAYFMSDRLTQDCLKVTEEKLKSSMSFLSFVSHEFFGMALVPVDVVRSVVQKKAACEVIHLVINWLGDNPPFEDDGVKEMKGLAIEHAKALSVEEARRVDEFTAHGDSKSIILLGALLTKLEGLKAKDKELEAKDEDLGQSRATLFWRSSSRDSCASPVREIANASFFMNPTSVRALALPERLPAPLGGGGFRLLEGRQALIMSYRRSHLRP